MKKIYHGSPELMEKLIPMNLHGDPDVGNVIFGTPDRNFALTFLRKWSDKDINQSTRGADKKIILQEMRPGAFEEIYGGKPGYLYHLDPSGFSEIPTRKFSKIELQAKREKIPLLIEKIEDALLELKKNPDISLEGYKEENLRDSIKRLIKRMKEMTPEGRAEYLSWRSKDIPEESKKILMEELSKMSSVKDNTMPFKSKDQMKLFFAKEDRGELPKGTSNRWLEHTKNVNSLPKKIGTISKKSEELQKEIDISLGKISYV